MIETMSREFLTPEEKAETETRVTEYLTDSRGMIERDASVMSKALEGKLKDPLTEPMQNARALAIKNIAQDNAAIEWLDNPDGVGPEIRLLVADLLDRHATNVSWIATGNMGSERVFGKSSGITNEEIGALQLAGELTYYAHNLRRESM